MMKALRTAVATVSLTAAALLGLSAEEGAASGGATSYDEEGCAQRVLEVDSTLKAESAALEAKASTWELSARAYFPSLSLDIGDDERVAVGAADSFSKRLGLTIDATLWDGGKLDSDREFARAEIALARAALARKAAELAESARRMYRDCLSLREKIKIAERAVAAAEGQFGIAKLQFSLGNAKEIDLLDIEGRVYSSALQLEELRAELDDAEYALAKALRLGEGSRLLLSGGIDAAYAGMDIPPAILEELKLHAALRNPDLAVKRFQIAKAETVMAMRERAWLPSVKLSGNLGFSGAAFPLDKFTYSFSLIFEFGDPAFPLSAKLGGGGGDSERSFTSSATGRPLSDLSGPLTEATDERSLKAAKEAYADAVSESSRSMERLSGKYERARKSLALSRKQKDLAERKLAVAKTSLDLGQSTILDYLDAEDAVAKAGTSLIDSALSLVAAEREIEALLDLRPKGLEAFLREIARTTLPPASSTSAATEAAK